MRDTPTFLPEPVAAPGFWKSPDDPCLNGRIAKQHRAEKVGTGFPQGRCDIKEPRAGRATRSRGLPL
jgi:hypothetical protein